MVISTFILAAVIIEFAFLFIVRPDILMQMQNFMSSLPWLSGRGYNIDDFIMKNRFVTGAVLFLVGLVLIGEGAYLSAKKVNASFFESVAVESPVQTLPRSSIKRNMDNAVERKASNKNPVSNKSVSPGRMIFVGQTDYVGNMFKDDLQMDDDKTSKPASRKADTPVSVDTGDDNSVATDQSDTLIEDKELLKLLEQEKIKSAPVKQPSVEDEDENKSLSPDEMIEDEELRKFLRGQDR